MKKNTIMNISENNFNYENHKDHENRNKLFNEAVQCSKDFNHYKMFL